MKAALKSKALKYSILLIIILLSTTRIIYIFATKKDGYHSDEVWSYGIANSHIGGSLYYDEEKKDFYNYLEWVDGDIIRTYLTVGDDEAFTFANTYKTTTTDLNPPLYELLLHFVCSFFKNSFSWWYAFILNVVAALASMFFFYLLCKEFSGDELFSLVNLAFFSCSISFMASTVYLRGYAYILLFTILLLLNNLRLYKKNYTNVVPEYIAIFVVSFLGYMTHYSFLPFAFAVTISMVIALVLKRKWLDMLLYGAVMLASVSVFFLAYPTSLNTMFNKGYNAGRVLLNTTWQNEDIALDAIFVEVFGIPWYISLIEILYIIFAIFMLIVISALLIFLFRNEKWFRPVIEKLNKIKNILSKDKKNGVKLIINKINYFYMMLIIASVGMVHFVVHYTSVESMMYRTDRYLFLLTPLLIIIFSYPFYKFLRKICKQRVILAKIIFVVINIAFIFFRDWSCGNTIPYLWEKSETNVDTVELTKDAHVIVITSEVWRIEWYCTEFYKCDDFYLMFTDSYEYLLTLIDEPADDKPIYFFIEEDSFLADYMKKINDAGEEEIEVDVNNIAYYINLKTHDTFPEFLDNVVKDIDWVSEVRYVDNYNSFCGDIQVYELIRN